MDPQYQESGMGGGESFLHSREPPKLEGTGERSEGLVGDEGQ